MLQSVAYVINRHSNLPLVSRFQIYDTFRDYLLEQEFRIQQLENRIKELEQHNASVIVTKPEPKESNKLVILNENQKQKSLMKI